MQVNTARLEEAVNAQWMHQSLRRFFLAFFWSIESDGCKGDGDGDIGLRNSVHTWKTGFKISLKDMG